MIDAIHLLGILQCNFPHLHQDIEMFHFGGMKQLWDFLRRLAMVMTKSVVNVSIHRQGHK